LDSIETVFKNPMIICRQWDERTSASGQSNEQTDHVFENLFERSFDAIWLFDPEAGVVVDCNQAAVELMGASDKRPLLQAKPADLSPPVQADGTLTQEKSVQITALVERNQGHRFEWLIRRMDGIEVPLEISATPVRMGTRKLHVLISRDISERKRAEAQLRESEEKFRELFEASTDAIAILDPQTRQNIACNEAMAKMAGAGGKEQFLSEPVDRLAPERQPDGRSSNEAARDWIERALSHGPQRFDWVARRFTGVEFPVEVLLTPLRLGGRTLVVTVFRDISQRKRAERDLLEMTQTLERRVAERTAALTTSEARFRALVEHAPEAIVVFDGDTGRFLFGNQHACRLYGVAREQLTEFTPADVSPEFQPNGQRSTELAREKMSEALTGGTPVFEWLHQRPDGCLVPTEVRLLRLPAEGQNLIRASTIDNSERKLAEKALRDSEEKFRALFEGSKERVRISTLNAEVGVALNAGTDLGPMLQRCAQLLVQHLEVAFARVWILNDATQTLELAASAGCYTHLDGHHSRVRVGQYKIGLIAQEKKAHLTSNVQTDPRVSNQEWAKREGMIAFAGYPLLLEGRVLGVLAMFARRPLPDDILTALGSVADSLALGIERKRAQKALVESEARFSAAFQASPVLIGVMRKSDEKYVLVNDAFVNWMGYSRDEMTGRTSAELGMWDSLADRALVWDDLRGIGSVRQQECRWRDRAGRLFTFLLSTETIALDNEPHLLSFALDISQRKQAEVEMIKALDRERELSQLKSNFVSMVSHQFRTPLGIIQSSSELLRDFYSRMQGTERAEHLEAIARNTRRMAGMMEEILVLSRLDAGKLDFQPAPLDLSAFCRRLVDEVLSTTNRCCRVELALPPALPLAAVDERLLGHIFTNLLSNAVKYSEAGTCIRFTVQPRAHDALFTVEDEGIGISQEDRQKLFTAFHRGANVGTRSGTGLGLVVVKRCVELHSGSLQIESQLAKGTTVRVRIPAF
jgi:PAS domain S-box-containing protein